MLLREFLFKTTLVTMKKHGKKDVRPKKGIPLLLNLLSVNNRFSLLIEHIPLNPEDSDSHETDIESSKTL